MLSRITLDHLRVLIAVADTGTFSAAARRLGRVQSAISQSVQLLESGLAVSLFDRGGKTPRLTEIGRLLLEDSRQIVRAADMLQVRAEALTANVEPVLTIAIDGICPATAVMNALNAVRQNFPNLSVTLFTEGLSGPEHRLRAGAAQLAVYVPMHGSGLSGLASEFLAEIPLAPVAASDHALAKAPQPLTKEMLEHHVQLVMVDPAQTMAPISGSIMSPQTWSFSALSVRKDYLLAGFGWCHAPLHLVEDEIAAGKLKRLQLQEPSAKFLNARLHVVHEPGRPPGKAGRLFVQELRKQLEAGDSGPTRRQRQPRRAPSGAPPISKTIGDSELQ